MAKSYSKNDKANEAISKFKLLSAYGGPGSIIHTEYGSVLISCIEEWGFIQAIREYREDALKIGKEPLERVPEQALLNELGLSNDGRLMEGLRRMKSLDALEFLVLIPDIELDDFNNSIKRGKREMAINSIYMPKGFFDKKQNYKLYHKWHALWKGEDNMFSPPMYIKKNEQLSNGAEFENILLKQDNMLLICNKGHMSDFPWSQFLRWRTDAPYSLNQEVDLLGFDQCCANPAIQITDTQANATGFDGKWIKCRNHACNYSTGVSLKGINSVKIQCHGHRPWEVETGDRTSYFGKSNVRRQHPPADSCTEREMVPTLSTANNLYFSRHLSSLYLPMELLMDERLREIERLQGELNSAIKNEKYYLCEGLHNQIKALNESVPDIDGEEMSDQDHEMHYRFQEYQVLTTKQSDEINSYDKNLKVFDVTANLNDRLGTYFSKVLRIDSLKITSAQLDFSRVQPMDGDTVTTESRNIFRMGAETVVAYPVVENYGEGIFFAFNQQMIESLIGVQHRFSPLLERRRTSFSDGAVEFARERNWPLYLIHTFSHLIMRELEFLCGYPTASLSERLYVSRRGDEEEMFGCLIYTTEGEEGSMGGLIAQTRTENLNKLINSAFYRASVCNSDPLCWSSDGQGLFELNLAACFSCSLVSETSCEARNLYLDRKIVVDSEIGYFRGYRPEA